MANLKKRTGTGIMTTEFFEKKTLLRNEMITNKLLSVF